MHRKRTGATLLLLSLAATAGAGGTAVSREIAGGLAVSIDAGEPGLGAPAAMDSYLLSASMGGEPLEGTVPAIAGDGRTLLELSALVAVLELPIRREGPAWTGWVRSPGEPFHHEMDATGTWSETDGGVFVDTETLAGWLGLGLHADLRQQSLTITSPAPLPFQERRARSDRRARGVPAASPPPEEIRDVYRWLTAPLFDVTAYFGARRADGRTTTGEALQVDLAMDLLKHSLTYHGSISDATSTGTESRQRLTMSRDAATADETLFLGATGYELGDVFARRTDLVNGGGPGVGFRIERSRAGVSDGLGRAVIEGDGTPGWDVELHRDGVPVAFGIVGPDGRYVFPDQDVSAGDNVFVARMFGPQGEVMETRHVVHGGGNELAPGDFEYELSHVDFRRRLLDGEIDDAGALPSGRTTDARFRYGLSRGIQVGGSATLATLPAPAGGGGPRDAWYAGAFARASFGRHLFLAEADHQLGEGWATSLQYLTSFHGQDLRVMHQRFDGFESPATLRGTALDSLTQVSLHGATGLARVPSYLVRASLAEREEGGSELRVFGRVGMRLGRVSVGNDLEYVDAGKGDASLRGSLRASGRLRSLGFSAQLDYDLLGDSLLQQASATVRWGTGRLHGTTTVRKDLAGDGDLHVENVLSVRVRRVDVSLTVGAGTDDTLSVGVTVGMHFGRRGPAARIRRGTGMASVTGDASLTFFVDEDDDGIRDAGEERLDWVEYDGTESSPEAPGMLTFAGLSAGPTVVHSDRLRFEDPFLVPGAASYVVTSHAGGQVRADLPLRRIGDVEGVVEGGGPGLALRLEDEAGEPRGEARTDRDGFYSFTGIPSGTYRVRLLPGPDGGEQASSAFTFDAGDAYVTAPPLRIPADLPKVVARH